MPTTHRSLFATDEPIPAGMRRCTRCGTDRPVSPPSAECPLCGRKRAKAGDPDALAILGRGWMDVTMPRGKHGQSYDLSTEEPDQVPHIRRIVERLAASRRVSPAAVALDLLDGIDQHDSSRITWTPNEADCDGADTLAACTPPRPIQACHLTRTGAYAGPWESLDRQTSQDVVLQLLQQEVGAFPGPAHLADAARLMAALEAGEERRIKHELAAYRLAPR